MVANEEHWVYSQKKAYHDLVLRLAQNEIIGETEFYLGLPREWIEDGELEQSGGRYTVFWDLVQRDTVILLDKKEEVRWLTFKRKGAHGIVVTPN